MWSEIEKVVGVVLEMLDEKMCENCSGPIEMVCGNCRELERECLCTTPTPEENDERKSRESLEGLLQLRDEVESESGVQTGFGARGVSSAVIAIIVRKSEPASDDYDIHDVQA